MKIFASLIVRIVFLILIVAGPFVVALGTVHILGGLATVSLASMLQWGIVALLVGISLDGLVRTVARTAYFLSGLEIFHTQAIENIIALVLLLFLYLFVAESIWFALLAALINAVVAAAIAKIIPGGSETNSRADMLANRIKL
ncbi:hypothetical protein [Corynebacterium pseudodiphtheriticum]|uniref:hypothetical protein n=1 Tax=Corynebacterium pseudodiphtheriticum TaxID=37637 RepID=UPI002550CE0D|nr:hypothetical protein [Corynebacterium pseudodiphtheriticum]MDK8478712.1 hypothetical protein [Corynebacterium pseudodiphtheriticum]MDK8563082.1 hypothetical protein [Corynebacterium pseudodiphtheriticum]MDK8685202.1 hypothetical protein [Corynebacterium pseudodiphtheriticum]